jgi:tetratricopeptide (TPR) repeat protein
MNETSVRPPGPVVGASAEEPPAQGRRKRDLRLWAGGATTAWALKHEAWAQQQEAEEGGAVLPPKRPSSIPRLREMIKADPKNFQALKRLVEILVGVKRFDQAIELLDRAIARNRHARKANALKVYVLSSQGEGEKALAFLRGLPEDGIASPLERVLIEADVLLKFDRTDEAAQVLEEATRLAPGDWQAARRLAQVAVRREQWNRVVELLQPLLDEGRPLGAEALLLGATLIEKLGDFDAGYRAYASRFDADLAADLQVRAFFQAAAPGWIRTNSVLSQKEAAYSPTEIARLEQRLLRSIEAGEPLALIRLLDGEGRTFEGSDRSLDGAAYWDDHVELLSVHEMEKFQGHFLAAVKQADILGLPNESMVRNPYNRAVINHLDGTIISRIRRGEMAVVDQPCHFHMQMAGSFERLLKDRDFVGVISGRDVTPYLTQQLGVRRVVWHATPGQARHDGLGPKPHYPARFDEIYAELEVPRPGAIYLVGAGIVGKVYCAEIKRRGGVAIDIGAIADVWAGRMDTRPFLTRNVAALAGEAGAEP